MKTRLLALACLAAAFPSAPASAQTEAVDTLRCSLVYPVRVGFLKGVDAAAYDPVAASELITIGFTFSMYAVEQSDLKGESIGEFREISDRTLNEIRDELSSFTDVGAAENFFEEELGACIGLRDADPDGFADRRAQAEAMFAPQIEAIRNGGEF